MLVLDEYVDQWYIYKTTYDYASFMPIHWQADLRAMVDKDYNHPSVVMYSIGNEVSETAYPQGIVYVKAMVEYLHQLDSVCPVTCGINLFFNWLSTIGLGVHSNEKAKRNDKQQRVGSQFYNQMAGILGSRIMKLGALLGGCDRKTRDAYAEMDVAGYNYGILRYTKDLRNYPDRLIIGTETFCNDIWHYASLASRFPRLIGDFVWTGMDYLGEVGIGAWEYPADAPREKCIGWISAGAGRIDLTGKLLCEAHYTRVALGVSDGPYLGVRFPHHRGEKHTPSAWKFSDALDSWSWAGYERKIVTVEAYARCHHIAVYINDRLVACRRMNKRFVVRMHCTYTPGTLLVVAYDKHGLETGRMALSTANETTCLHVEPEALSVQPNSLCYIRLRYCDTEGISKPTERGILKVTCIGGNMLALGSACPYQPYGFDKTKVATYHGEALAICRADTIGTMHVEATDGIRHAYADISISAL